MDAYFVGVSDGEHRDFQGGFVAVTVEAVPSLGSQL